MSSTPGPSTAPPSPDPVISIVIPAQDEAGNLEPLVADLATVLPSDMAREIIIVDDGSRDDTWPQICSLNAQDPGIRGIRLSRNFGHQYALLAGLTHARGRAVITMDADLQHPASVIPALLERWKAGARIVHTIRRDSKNASVFKRMTAKIFYRGFSYLSGVDIRPGMADFRLLDRIVVDSLLRFNEEGLFLRGLVHWVGFESASVEFESAPRLHGSSSYSLKKMAQLAWTGVTSFSLVPLRLGVLVGLVTSLLAFSYLGFAVVAKLSGGTTVPGWASAVSIVSLLFGILFIILGLVGEYIGRILIEVRQRPRYIASSTVGFPDEESVVSCEPPSA